MDMESISSVYTQNDQVCRVLGVSTPSFERYRATDYADRSNMNIGLCIPSPVRSEQYLCERPLPIPAPKGIGRISSDSSKPC